MLAASRRADAARSFGSEWVCRSCLALCRLTEGPARRSFGSLPILPPIICCYLAVPPLLSRCSAAVISLFPAPPVDQYYKQNQRDEPFFVRETAKNSGGCPRRRL